MGKVFVAVAECYTCGSEIANVDDDFLAPAAAES
jgi:hypothetical protein